MEKYFSLNEQTVVDYVNQLCLVDYIFDEASEIGDGNLNLVFKLHSKKTGNTIIVKQALPYAKVVGESWPLTITRSTIEYEALKIYQGIVPHLVPEVYYHNPELAVTVMEDLSQYTITRTGLINREHYPLLSKHIGEFIAKSLFFTSDYGSSPEEKKKLEHIFYNPELCKITEDLVFTDPFYQSETNNFEDELKNEVVEIWKNSELNIEVAKLKALFLTKREALIHGDLHTGSIFSSRQNTKVIDPEFAIVGPFGFDIAQYIANLYLQAISRDEVNKEECFDYVSDVWGTFIETFRDLWNQYVKGSFRNKEYLNDLLKSIEEDAIGFAGCEMIRRTIGLAHVADLDGIEDKEKRIGAKIEALEIGRFLILNRKALTVLESVKIVRKSVSI